MRFAKHLAVSLAMVGALAALVSSNTFAETNEEQTESRVYAKIYRMSDLPVFTIPEKHLDPSILIALLKAKIGDDARGDDFSAAIYPQSLSLVVSTTDRNHAIVGEVLDELRLEQFKRSEEFRRTSK